MAWGVLETLLVLGIVAGLAGEGYNVAAQKTARVDASRANEKAARIERVKGIRERQIALARTRKAVADINAQAAAGGTLGASGVAGATGGLLTQTGANIGVAGQIDSLRTQESQLQGRALASVQRGQDVLGGASALSSGFITGSQIKF